MAGENVNTTRSNTEEKSGNRRMTKQQETTSDDVLNCMNANALIHKMAHFVLQQKFDDFISLPKLREQGKIFYYQEGLAAAQLNDLQQLKDFDFSDPKKYNIEISYAQRNIITCFRDELMIVISREKGEPEKEEYKLIRQVNPPLEAYTYEAFTKADIKDTGRNYGTLFES
jgi:hypothetical protein